MGIVLVALLSNYTIRTLLKCGDKVMQMKEKEKITDQLEVTPPTYPEIGRAAFGAPGMIKIIISSLYHFPHSLNRRNNLHIILIIFKVL